VRLGVLAGTVRPELDSGPVVLAPESSSAQQGALTMKLILDRMDSVHFPREGWRGSARLYHSTDALGADDRYTKWDTDATGAYSFGNHTFNVGLKAGGRIGSDPLPRYDSFQWGGFLHQSGYAIGQLFGQKLLFGRLMYYQRVLRGSLLEGAYAGVSLEVGRMYEPIVPGNNDALIRSGSLFVAADTPVGPAYLAYGRATDGNSNLYFYLGRPF
jgi:NTE family protein